MPVSPSSARHRTAGRPSTALSGLAETATGSLAKVGRRSAVVLASSGLAMSALAAPASATPQPAAPAAELSGADTSALTASARAILDASRAVTVPAGTSWSIDVPALSVVADPPPKPAPVVRRPAPQSVVPAPADTAAPTAAETPAAAEAAAPGSAVIEIASRYLEVPYLWGGGTPNGFDCSGFTSYVYAQLGITLPHSSAAQRNVGMVVARADARPGDLIVTPGHVALYAGGDMLIDATPGKTIQFHAVYQSNPVFIRVG